MRPLSIRARLQLWFAGLSGTVLIVFAVIVAERNERAAMIDLDARLAVRNQSLAALCECEDGHLGCELKPEAKAAFAGTEPRRRFLIQSVTGRELLAASDEAAATELLTTDARSADEPTAPSPRSVRGQRVLGRTYSVPGENDRELLVRVVTAEDERPVRQAQRRLELALAAGVVTALIGIAVAGALLARRVVDPIGELAAVAERIQAGRPEPMPRSGSGDEIDHLAASFTRAMDRVQEALARQTRFTADASHELRTPLAIVRTQAEVALRSTRDGEEYRRALREITTGVERMSGTLESLLLLARADTGNLDYVEDDVDVGMLVHDVFERHGATAAHKGLELRLVAATNAVIRGDHRLLSILLDNLVANAIRYSDRPGFVAVDHVPSSAGLSLRVADQGIGIPPERLPHIWERFFRADDDRSRRVGGSGLGLSIVRAIAERHGATCRATSEVGNGTRIEVQFPADRVRLVPAGAIAVL